MYPEVFRIGSITVHSYGLMIALAILVISAALYREAPRERIDRDHILEAVIVAGFSGLLGARILYVIFNWGYYSTQPFTAFFTQFEGLSFYGGLFLATAVIYFWCRWRRIGFLKLTDILAPYLALGYAFGRVGCFLNGCCYGLESDMPWALPAGLADDLLRHPVQLYAAIGALVIFVLLKMIRPRRPFVGFLTISLFAFYGLLRFTTEFFRQETAVWLGLTTAQLFSLGLIMVSLLFIAALFYIFPDRKGAEEEPSPTRKGKRKAKKKAKK